MPEGNMLSVKNLSWPMAVVVAIVAWFIHSAIFDRYYFVVATEPIQAGYRFNKITGSVSYLIGGKWIDVATPERKEAATISDASNKTDGKKVTLEPVDYDPFKDDGGQQSSTAGSSEPEKKIPKGQNSQNSANMFDDLIPKK